MNQSDVSPCNCNMLYYIQCALKCAHINVEHIQVSSQTSSHIDSCITNVQSMVKNGEDVVYALEKSKDINLLQLYKDIESSCKCCKNESESGKENQSDRYFPLYTYNDHITMFLMTNSSPRYQKQLALFKADLALDNVRLWKRQHCGIFYDIKRHPNMGNLTYYILIPSNTTNIDDIRDILDQNMHGGITFEDCSIRNNIEYTIFGCDYLHFGDFTPHSGFENDVYTGYEEVCRHARNLIEILDVKL